MSSGPRCAMGVCSHDVLIPSAALRSGRTRCSTTSFGRCSLWNGTTCAIRDTMSASENGTEWVINAAQVRAARGLLAWSQDQLVEASSVPRRTIARLELGEGEPQKRTLTAIRTALEAAGVEFIEENGGGVGVRLRKISAIALTS